MTVNELITYCTLKGNIDYHKELRPGFWRVRMIFPNQIVTFLYYKDTCSDDYGFLSGRISSRRSGEDETLGLASEAVWDFNELMEKLGSTENDNDVS